ncbi:MAG: hypothetical protein IJ106_12645 [Parasporobacterium sp.]|nr:hypothetical protein [Parasporobacterium sp.]
MNGKDKCRILKDIRKSIAEQNDIEWVVSECTHKGNCKGTCPKCESEVRQLERELSLRRRLGKAVALTGVSAACIAGLTGCTLEDVAEFGEQAVQGIRDLIVLHEKKQETEPEIIELDGEVAYEAWIDNGEDDSVFIPEDELSGYISYDDMYDARSEGR